MGCAYISTHGVGKVRLGSCVDAASVVDTRSCSRTAFCAAGRQACDFNIPMWGTEQSLHQSSVSLRRHRRAVWGDGLGVRVLRARRAVIIFRNERLTIEGQHLLVRGRREGRGRVDYYLM
jgi:hypothetical protein